MGHLALEPAPERREDLRAGLGPTLDLECSTCGYGIVRATPPERCPMCQSEGTWTFAPWRPFTGRPRT